MRESVIDGSARLMPGTHRIEPIFDVMRVIIVGTDRVRFGSTGHTHDFTAVLGRAHAGRSQISRLVDVTGRDQVPVGRLRPWQEIATPPLRRSCRWFPVSLGCE